MKLFIHGEVPSSKNSKRIFRQGNKTLLVSSSFTQRYVKETELQWELHKNVFLKATRKKSKPYFIGFQFVRATRRRFDFVNLLQCPLDMMVKYGWIDDDNYLEIVPVINPRVFFDKNSPGLEITVLKPPLPEGTYEIA